MSSNTIGPLPKNSDSPSGFFTKKSGDLDDTKNSLVTTIDTVVKEGTTEIVYRKVRKNLMW